MIRKTEHCVKLLAVFVPLSCPFVFDVLVFSRIFVMQRILLLEAQHQMSLFPSAGPVLVEFLGSLHIPCTHNNRTKEGALL